MKIKFVPHREHSPSQNTCYGEKSVFVLRLIRNI